jgi:hypothetical protein
MKVECLSGTTNQGIVDSKCSCLGFYNCRVRDLVCHQESKQNLDHHVFWYSRIPHCFHRVHSTAMGLQTPGHVCFGFQYLTDSSACDDRSDQTTIVSIPNFHTSLKRFWLGGEQN